MLLYIATAALTLVIALSAIAADNPTPVKHIADPCRARNVLSARFVKDPKSGHECVAMVDMNEIIGAELLLIDLKTGKGKSYKCPAGQGGWALMEVPGNRLVVGTFYDGQYMVFDLNKKQFIKSVGFPGESYIWEFALGSDGRLYGGTYAGGKLLSLDLNDYTVRDCGAPAPPNMYLRNLSSLPDGRILCNFGMEKPTTLIYDPKTSKFEPVPKQLEGLTKGISWNGYFLAGSRAFKGADLEEQKQLPIPLVEGETGYWIDPGSSTADTLVLAKGSEIYTYQKGDKSLTQVNKTELKGGRLLDSSAGKVVGIRGQDYFILAKGKKTTFKRMPMIPGSRETLFLRADGKGNLWGGPSFGQTLFQLDPKSGKFTNTATVCDGGGEVYDACFIGNEVFAVAYSGGDIIRYNPSQPWDQFNNINPKTIFSVGAKGYIRPVGGVSVGPDGKLYSGWMAGYGKYGGAIAITDPSSGETKLIENPLGEMAVYGLAVDKSNLYIGTSTSANGLPNKPSGVVEFGVMGIAGSKILFRKEFPGTSGVHIAGIDLTLGKVVVEVDNKLMLFDTGKMSFEDQLPADIPLVTSYCSTVYKGCFYYSSQKSIIKMDLSTLKWQTVAEMPETARNVAVASGKIYVSCGASVYEVPAK
jgi:hypothetical protein